MLKKSFFLLTLLIMGLNHVLANPGIQIGATRLIYNENNTQASVNVINSSNNPYLIQSWITNIGEKQIKQDSLFITTPPLFRLDANATNTVRVMAIGGITLPKDRESVFWLNIKAIPSIEKTDNNKLIIAIKSQIKLFYRPLGLKGEANDAYKSIRFFSKNDKLNIDNPTPFNISFNTIKINGTELQDTIMIPPFTTKTLSLKAKKGQTATWDAINDYGGIAPEITMKVENQ